MKSPLGIQRCTTADWSVFAVFIAGSLLLTWAAVRLINKERQIKERAEQQPHQSLRTLLFVSLFGGFVSGAFGLGGGSIFNPVLIELGVPPSVSSATGMYMVMLSNMATSVMYASYG